MALMIPPCQAFPGILITRKFNMRMVMLLIVLAIIGLTLTRWLGHKPPPPPVSQATSDHAAPPAAPTRPEDLKAFEKDLNRFMQDAARQRQENAP